MFKQHFKVILASVGLIGMTWLCGCKTSGQRCPHDRDVAAASTPEQTAVADNSDGREVAPPPPAENKIPYEEPVAKDTTTGDQPLTPFPEEKMVEDDQPLTPSPEEKMVEDDQPPMESPVAKSETQADPQAENTTPAESEMKALETPRDHLAELRRLGALVELNRGGDAVAIDLSATKAADSDLRHLKDLTKIEQLNLRGTQVTDAGLVHLKTLAALKLLDLGKTAITDDGLVHFKEMNSLEYLLLGHTKITDAGLEQLQELTNLKGLSLIKTGITAEGMKKLKQSLPNCQIVTNIRAGEGTTPAANDEQKRETHEKDTAEAEGDEVSDRETLPSFETIMQIGRNDQPAESKPVAVVASVSKGELNLNDPAVLGSVGEFYASQGRWSEAVDVLNSALTASPETDVLRYRLGVALARTGDVDAAIPHLVKTTGQAHAHYNLGVILYENALQASEHHFQQAIQQKPDFDDARFWLSEIRSARDRMPKLNDPFRTAQSSYDLLPLPMICPASRPVDTRQARLR